MNALGLQHPEFGGGAVDGAPQTCFVTVEGSEGRTACGESVEGESAAGWFIDARELAVDARTLAIHFEVERRRFDRHHAAEAPASGDDVVNEIEFGLSGRLPVLEVGGEELVKFFLVLIGEDDDLAGEPVHGGVAGRAGFAFGGNRSARARSIATGGFLLFARTHAGGTVSRRRADPQAKDRGEFRIGRVNGQAGRVQKCASQHGGWRKRIA